MTPLTRLEIWMCGYVLGIVTMLIRENGNVDGWPPETGAFA